MDKILRFALKGKGLVHIDDVPRGDNCGCVCPSCNGKLRANKGKIKQHYFSHQSGENCQSAIETALHLAAKDILSSVKEFKLPALTLEESMLDDDNKKHTETAIIVKKNTKVLIDKGNKGTL